MKSKSIIFCLFFLISLINLWAQNTITNVELAKIKENAYKEFHPGIQSAIVENSIKKLSLNPQLRSQPDPYFKYQIQTGKPTDQKRSGRCWMFASILIREKLIYYHFGKYTKKPAKLIITREKIR